MSVNDYTFVHSLLLTADRLLYATLLYERIHGRTTYQPDLTTFLQPRHIPTQGYNITQSSVPDDGHMVARNILSKYLKRNKNYRKLNPVGFSYPQWPCVFFISIYFQSVILWCHSTHFSTGEPTSWPTDHHRIPDLLDVFLARGFLLYLLACSITLYLVILQAIYIEFTLVIFTLRVYSGYSFYMDCY